MGDNRVKLIVGGTLVLLVGFVLGILIGWFSGPNRVDSVIEEARKEADDDISKRLIELVDNEKIDEYLKFLSSEPHVAGTDRSKALADWVKEKFTEFGFDEAEISTYNVLLSYPSKERGKENVVQKLVPDPRSDSGYLVEYESQTSEPILDGRPEDENVLPPYNAYSAKGIVEGDLVYANYGSIEDFLFLQRDLGINITDKIVMIRYGQFAFRGTKAKFAAQFGAKGVILFSDPEDFTVPGEPVYPDSRYLPPTGAQRGGVLKWFGAGDPLTPGYPSVESAYRYPEEGSDKDLGLPEILIHPISANDAKVFLSMMGGDEVKPEWRGGLEGVTYRYGPGFATPTEKVRMKIFTERRRTDAWNVVGTIRGSVEPDRYVMMGNHRDSWVFGALDASSGTSSMMEVARSFGRLLSEGWRPRRTLKFCSWGAEEFGSIGSTEWTEEFAKTLDNRAVSYLNLDLSIYGTYVPSISSTPILYNTIREATKLIPDPTPEEFDSLYDRWQARGVVEDGEPSIHNPGSGTDFAPFIHGLGVSVIDYSMAPDGSLVGIYPMYHSAYETYKLVKTFYDPNFRYLQSSARICAELLRRLADSKVIPFSVSDYATRIGEFLVDLREGETGQKMIAQGLSFDLMQESIDRLKSKADEFQNYVDNDLDRSSLLAVRDVNDRLMNFERSFIDTFGLPQRPTMRHVIFASSSRNSYASDVFAGILDTMSDIDYNPDPNKWSYVEQQLAAITYAFDSAAHSLE